MAICLWLIASLVAAAPGYAATAEIAPDNGDLLYTAAFGERNDVTIRYEPGAYVIEDPGAALQPARGCQADGSRVRCPSTVPQPVALTLRDRGDRARLVGLPRRAGDRVRRDSIEGESGGDVLVAADRPADLDGGPGDDLLTGGGAGDDLYGGLGADRVNGRGGADTVHYLRRDYATDDFGQPQPDDPLRVTDDGVPDDGKPGEMDNVIHVEQVVTLEHIYDGGPGADEMDPEDPDTDDLFRPGAGPDKVLSLGGDDIIDSRDGERDVIDCGAGRRDLVYADPVDQVDKSTCEQRPNGDPTPKKTFLVSPVGDDDLLAVQLGNGNVQPLSMDDTEVPNGSTVTAADGEVEVQLELLDKSVQKAEFAGEDFTLTQDKDDPEFNNVELLAEQHECARDGDSQAPRPDEDLADEGKADALTADVHPRLGHGRLGHGRAGRFEVQTAASTSENVGSALRAGTVSKWRTRIECDETITTLDSGEVTVTETATGETTVLDEPGDEVHARLGHG